MNVSCVINRRGETVKAFAEILLELGLLEYQRITEADEKNIGRANFVHLCAASPQEILSAENS